MRKVRFSLTVLCFLTAVGLAGQAQAYPPQNLTDWGPAKAVGNGTAQTFYVETRSGKPVAIGFELSSGALDNLPTAYSDGMWEYKGHTCCGHETVLDFPASALQNTAFEWFGLNWNPQGHIPPGIYDVPHFDMHFYTMPYQDRFAIEPGLCAAAPPGTLISCDSFYTGLEPLPADMEPGGGFVNVGAVEAGMGAHMIDLTGPEWNGETFTHTYIWGVYDGEITFQEPMITRDYLLQKHEEVCTPYAAPQAMPEAGYYPTEYCIRYDERRDSHQISLESFEYFEQADGIVE